MSSDGTPMSDNINTRFSTPAPELDDHRPRRPSAAPVQGRAMTPPRLAVPTLEVHEATPRGSIMGPSDLLQVDDALRLSTDVSPVHHHHSIARDFENENAVSDESEDGSEVNSPAMRRGSARRDTGRRAARPRELRQNDRSRDTSSSRSTSPANSVEAFAEPRRRQRANTVSSLPESIELQRFRTRTSSPLETRRPTLSNVSAPNLQSRVGTYEEADRNTGFAIDDEPGKTYTIDFEELEEFAALCKQGKIPVELHSASTSDESGNEKVFHDRRGAIQQDVPNAALNGETFFEKPLQSVSSATLTAEGKQPVPKPKRPAVDRFTFFSTDVQKPIYAKSLVDFVADGTKFQELFDVGPEGGVWWLDVLNPTQAELDVIASAFQIHRLTKEDIETQEPREKVELFRDYYFVCFRGFNTNKLSEDFLEPIHLYIIVTADGVLSFSYTPNPHARNVRKRISKVGDFVSLGPDYICYALIDDIVDSFAPIIHEAEVESENIEDQVFIAREDDFAALLRQIGEARKRVLNMMRLLGGKADVIKGFAKRCNEQFEMTPRGDIGLYLGDIQDHVVTMMSNLGHVEKMLSRSHANYLAQLSVDHLLKGNSTNKALAKITVVATILVPLNLITGLFGMNVHVPGQDVQGYAWFGGIIGVIALFVTTSVCIARRLKLI